MFFGRRQDQDAILKRLRLVARREKHVSRCAPVAPSSAAQQRRRIFSEII